MRLTSRSASTTAGRSAQRSAMRRANRPALLFAAAALSLGVSACGRSAPEGAAEEVAAPGAEPEAAGVRVVSEAQVIVPPPTTATVPTTVAATTPPPAAAAGTYIIEPGDTLSVIAERFGVTTDALSQANNITDVNTIRPGQELIIPAPG